MVVCYQEVQIAAAAAGRHLAASAASAGRGVGSPRSRGGGCNPDIGFTFYFCCSLCPVLDSGMGADNLSFFVCLDLFNHVCYLFNPVCLIS